MIVYWVIVAAGVVWTVWAVRAERRAQKADHATNEETA